MATTYGLTPQGFIVKQQQTIIEEINTSLQSVFGANINLGAESVFGQIVGVFSEREALIWQLGEAIYASQYPGGAEGTSVDNILALNNLKRLQATPTVTNSTPFVQSNGISLFGLVLFGTPGTVISAGSLMNNGATPPVQFTLDNDVTIAAAVDAVQSIFFSNIPNTGSFSISIVDAQGNTLTTSTMPSTSLGVQTLLSISTTPAGSSGFKLVLTAGGVALTTATISTNGAYPTALAIQNAIRALSGYSAVGVSGSAGSYTITWGAIVNPIVTVTANTTTATITPTDSVQANFNNLNDNLWTENPYPFSDVIVSGSFGTGFAFTFGSGTPLSGSLTSGDQPQALILVASNTLQQSSTVTNMNVVSTTSGAPAQGIGSATCTVTGPNYVKAGTLTIIGSPTSGWTGVTNQLDCLTGTNVEDDTAALQRRSALLAANANGPLQSIVQKVLEVPGVTSSIGFQNLTNAAQQVISFASVPVSGNWAITIAGQTTTNLAAAATAADVQNAIQALTGFSNVLVTGNNQYNFVINFNGAYGGQAIPLCSITNNTTGVVVTPYFGRPPKSFEIVVEGGIDSAIAAAIFESGPGGISTYGTPILLTTGSVNSGTTSLSVASTEGLAVGNMVYGPGIPNGTTITNIVGSTITLSLAAIGTYSNQQYTFGYAVQIVDSSGNQQIIAFSRPTQVPFYVSIVLLTDQYNTPGDVSSGVNPQAKFNPQSIATIQEDIIDIGNAVPIGGLVIGFGTNGLIGAFNAVPGIVSYTLYFGTSPNPVTNTNVQLQAEQAPLFETFNINVSYS